MKDFTSADRSPAMKALKKYLTLKEQIRQSALRSIERLNVTDDHSSQQDSNHSINGLSEAEKQELEILRKRQVEHEELERRQELELERLRQIEADRLKELEQVQFEKEQIEKSQIENQKESMSLPSEEIAVIEETEKPSEKMFDDVEQNEVSEDLNESSESIEDVSAIELDQTESSSETDSIDTDHVDDSEMNQVQVASVSLDDLTDNEELEDNFFDEEEDKTPIKEKSHRKKMKLPVKIALVALGLIASAGIVFTGVKMLNDRSSSTPDQVQTSSSSQSQQIEDTIFNVGDVLTITGTDGESLDVTIKEFKSDGSAVAEDANKDKWLITRDQMSEYARSHPDQFKKTHSSSNGSETSKDHQNKSGSSSESKSDVNSTTDASSKSDSNHSSNGSTSNKS